MLFFTLLIRMFDLDISPKDCKIHLACKNIVGEQPLDVYFGRSPGDTFDAWQSRQTKKNFERPYVVSLIQTPMPNRWLLAGVYDQRGCSDPRTGHPWCDETTPWFMYDLQRHKATEALNGRVIVEFDRAHREAGKKSGRNSYRNGEQCEHRLIVDHYRAGLFTAEDFGRFGQDRLAA
jgi:hypothetical protein